ncbi:hypothetical protein, partial [Escherichia coli]|uniref:hypothetical protein n=1 Tax=Escherichia coli TaxID=562 RepID=UPI0032E4C49C
LALEEDFAPHLVETLLAPVVEPVPIAGWACRRRLPPLQPALTCGRHPWDACSHMAVIPETLAHVWPPLLKRSLTYGRRR